MAGLNNLISNTAQQTTTLPTWFDTAQQNVVTQAGQAMGAAPTPQNTVAQNAVNALSGPTNAFTQAGGTLQNIASGAANPWITNQQTGQVTPDTSTAMGGLFQAQNQQLQQLMPNIQAQPTAGAIGSGNFGSLRGQTAVNKATADAQAQMNAAQYQAALQNQQTGVQAGSAAGNVAQQNINNLLTTGQYQQAAPYTNVSNYGKILGGIQAPTTVSNQTQLSPLNQYAGILSLLGGSSGTGGVLNQLGVKGGLQGLLGKVGNALGFGSSGSGSGLTAALNAGTYPLAGGGSMVIGADGTRIITQADGTVSAFDKEGASLGGNINAGEGGISESDLYNQESGNNTYTPDQLDDYQNYYDQP
jgi:hypothetical protein